MFGVLPVASSPRTRSTIIPTIPASISPKVDAYLARLALAAEDFRVDGSADTATALEALTAFITEVHVAATLGPMDVYGLLNALTEALTEAKFIAGRTLSIA